MISSDGSRVIRKQIPFAPPSKLVTETLEMLHNPTEESVAALRQAQVAAGKGSALRSAHTHSSLSVKDVQFPASVNVDGNVTNNDRTVTNISNVFPSTSQEASLPEADLGARSYWGFDIDESIANAKDQKYHPVSERHSDLNLLSPTMVTGVPEEWHLTTATPTALPTLLGELHGKNSGTAMTQSRSSSQDRQPNTVLQPMTETHHSVKSVPGSTAPGAFPTEPQAGSYRGTEFFPDLALPARRPLELPKVIIQPQLRVREWLPTLPSPAQPNHPLGKPALWQPSPSKPDTPSHSPPNKPSLWQPPHQKLISSQPAHYEKTECDATKNETAKPHTQSSSCQANLGGTNSFRSLSKGEIQLTNIRT